MKYGLVLDGQIICDPVDYSYLKQVAANRGFNLPDDEGEVELSVAGRLLLVVPSEDVKPKAPGAVAYYAKLTNWQFDAGKLRRFVEHTRMSFDDAIADLRRYIADQQDSALSVIESGYTAQEVKTWAQQQAEAAMWVADNDADVPLISQLAQRRNIPVSAVVGRINAKVTAAATLTGVILGDAQAADDRISSIERDMPDDWFNQLQDISMHWRKSWPEQLIDI